LGLDHEVGNLGVWPLTTLFLSREDVIQLIAPELAMPGSEWSIGLYGEFAMHFGKPYTETSESLSSGK
jgi:hypothetical protein